MFVGRYTTNGAPFRLADFGILDQNIFREKKCSVNLCIRNINNVEINKKKIILSVQTVQWAQKGLYRSHDSVIKKHYLGSR